MTGHLCYPVAMRYLRQTSHDPATNLAFEEAVFALAEEESLILWRNGPSVILGRNQNAYEELDFRFVEEHGIRVARRISGGGAVFHDLGNINYTVITCNDGDAFGNYERFTRPVREYLKTLGVHAECVGRNDLCVDGMKVSGGAQAVRGGRILHHGTLLFNADLSRLAGALKPHPAKMESRGIKSVRSRVTNIADHFSSAMGVEEFLEGLEQHFLRDGARKAAPSDAELRKADELRINKYDTFAWTIGESPKCTFSRTQRLECGTLTFSTVLSGGMMGRVRLTGDFFGVRDVAELEGRLNGVRYSRDAIERALEGCTVEETIAGLEARRLVEVII